MRRAFTEEFKRDAVKLVIETGISVTQAAKDLGIGDSTLHKWVTIHRSKEVVACAPVVVNEELKKLKAENLKLRLERDLLKKAAVFFATAPLVKVSVRFEE